MSGWSEYSFVLKPSPLGGIGVFATHDIPAGTSLFRAEGHIVRTLPAKDIPQELCKYCVYVTENECFAPERFDRMEIGWYINHAHAPNVASRQEPEVDSLTGKISAEK